MSYPSGPSGTSGNPGYPSGPPAPQYNAPTQQFSQVSDAAPAGPSKLPFYLAITVAVLGLAVYLASFGPVFTISAPTIPGVGPIGGAVSATPVGITLGTALAVLAGLLAGVGLLPKQTRHDAWVAILSVLALLLILSQIVGVPDAVSFGWALYLIILFSVLQAAAAVTGLLMASGVVTAPVPKPKYEQQHYGQYGGPSPYYGQPQHTGPLQHQQGPPQRPGYPSQYGGYPSGPSTGGFAAPQAPQPPQSPQAPAPSGPPTPPTGFPAFGQPQGGAAAQPAQPTPQPYEAPQQTYETPQSSYDSQQGSSQTAPNSVQPPS